MKIDNLVSGAFNLDLKDYKASKKKLILVKQIFFLQYLNLNL
ncbi:UDP-N-acetylenolpyruvoylglucosamine reductase [Borrelia duttonii CR2A]|uniref:UDP-N-acetylenolpyruvoylglucosamine reductase n=1 Tax=Borrelia duttonii CR2A TaxID=1432657 RepID=W6TYU5_9SPIR|nr:UDP-N-acetylenolpyruvoylglucosamine reductase [Borrelia duttonii CR2A]